MTLHPSSAGSIVKIVKIVHLSSVGAHSIRAQKLKQTFKTQRQSILTLNSVFLFLFFLIVTVKQSSRMQCQFCLSNNHLMSNIYHTISLESLVKNCRSLVVIWQLDLQLLCNHDQYLYINTNIGSSNPTQTIQHYVIQLVSELNCKDRFSQDFEAL